MAAGVGTDRPLESAGSSSFIYGRRQKKIKCHDYSADSGRMDPAGHRMALIGLVGRIPPSTNRLH